MSKKLEFGESDKIPLLLLTAEVEEIPAEGFKGRIWIVRIMYRTPDLQKHVQVYTASTADDVGAILNTLATGMEFCIEERKRGYNEG